MGYRLDYGPVKVVRRLERRFFRKAALTTLFFFLFCVLVCTLWADGREILQKLIFPGDLAVTAAALEELTTDLRTGAGILSSLKRFCMTVLENA